MAPGARSVLIFDRDLEQTRANSAPLTPLSFLHRAAAVYPEKTAVIHGERTYTYREFAARARRLASALARRGVGRGDRVAILAPNVPAMLEAHYGVPLAGAVLNPLNIRLDPAGIAFILRHGGAKVLIADREFAAPVKAALEQLETPLLVIEVADPAVDGDASPGSLDPGTLDYEALLEEGDADQAPNGPLAESEPICLLYTSGTTGNPKGALYSHRGAYVNAFGNLITFGLNRDSVYLWTLPMFHCSGWTFTWAVTAACATHVCLRKVEPGPIYRSIAEHGVSHMCGAPIVLTMLAHAPEAVKRPLARRVEIATGGAAPPSAVIEAMERQGFRVTHLYGLTESYGPAISCAWQEAWDRLDLEGRARRMARQGVRYLTLEEARVADPESLAELPWDGESMGEILLRGNTIMAGYLANPEATAAAFRGGWFHTGDLAVRHPDGYMEIKDRSKDIILSGGENISSLEVEEALTRHPKVLEAAVVAKPDPTWGETPCAFVMLKDGESATGEELIGFCRDRLAHFKAPKAVVFGPLPKTSTGKVQKFVLRERAKAI